MVLVDTSVWVDHLRRNVPLLADTLESGEVVTHPFVIGELACGNLANRREILRLISSLPHVPVATHAEALHLIEACRLQGRGIGWIDIHLLCSSRLAGVSLWTGDRKLQAAAQALRLARRT